jgi:zinc protease
MKHHCKILFGAAVVLLASTLCTRAQAPESPAKIVYMPLDWKVPLGAPYRQVLDNGLVAYIAEDHLLPLVKVSGYVRYGNICDSLGMEGISELMASLMRTGGTHAYQSDTLDALIDLYALKISISVSETQANFSCACLSEYTDTCLFILSQMLFSPAFEDNKIKKQTSIFLESIAHRFDNPDPILDAGFEKAMYRDGRNSRLATARSVGRITKKDLVSLHKNVFKTENMIVAASGNFSKATMVKQLTALFPKASVAPTNSPFPAIGINPLAKFVIVNRPISQSYVRLGLPLFKRPNNDFYPMQLLNLILGGEGFTSRLSGKVRSDEGLAYVIYSSAESNYIFPATFFVEFHTKNETASRATAISLEEISRIRVSGVTDADLVQAKKILVDRLPSMFRSPDDIVDNYANNEFLGRPADHFAVYAGKINAITKADLLTVAKKYLDPEKITYTVVGDTAEIFKNDTIPGFSLRSQKPVVVVNVPDSLFSIK